MLVIMQADVQEDGEEVRAVQEKALQYGLDPDVHCERGAKHQLVEVYLRDGESTPSSAISDHVFEQLEGVAEVRRITPARVRLSANGAADAHHIKISETITIGRGLPCQIIAGPCTVDQHVDTIIKGLREHGVRMIRGGCWKPRSRAQAFRGHGETGLRWLLKSAREHGMEAVFTEVVESHQIDVVRRVRDDIGYAGSIVLWVGARGIDNTMLLAKLGEQHDFLVMIKNGIHHYEVEEWYTQVEFVLAGHMHWLENGQLNAKASMEAGNNRILLCVRGTKKLDKRSPFRFNPNHDWIRTVHDTSWAPVGVDPSHSAGTMKGNLVLDNLQAALAYGPDFVLLEGGYPEKIRREGLCDVEQSVPLERISEALAMINDHNKRRFGQQTGEQGMVDGGWPGGD